MEQFNSQVIQRLTASPEIQSVSTTSYLPLNARESAISIQVEGHQLPPGQDGFHIQTFAVGPGYFTTMGTVLLQGREFTVADRAGALHVAVVNEAFARRFWPKDNPIGNRFRSGRNVYEVVGVVETGKYNTLGEDPRPVVFCNRMQEQGPQVTFVAHVRGHPHRALTSVRTVVRELDPRLSLARLGTLKEHLALALFPARTTGLLFTMFGAVALLLAVSGLFGVIAYSVSQRTREIGLRMALGAQRSDVRRLVLRQGLKLAGLGIGIGLLVALATTQLLRSLLFGISPTDPVTFVAVPLLLLGVAWLACWLPARRAAKVDPMVALRHD